MQAATATQSPTQPVLILLSGPNQNYHADSAWFALLQPLLAQHYQVHAIDRLGNGWSDDDEDLSYRRFADDLARLLPKLTSAADDHHQFCQRQYQQSIVVSAPSPAT